MSSVAGAPPTRRVTRNQTSAQRNLGATSKKQGADQPQLKVSERPKRGDPTSKSLKPELEGD